MDEMPPMAASPFRFGNSPCDAAACTSDSIARAGLPRADGGCDGGNDSADAQSEELVSMEIQQEPGSPSAVSDCSSIGSMVDELLDLEFVSRTVMASVDGACIDVSAPSVEIGSCMPVAHDNCEPHMAEDEIGTAVEEGAQEQLTRVRRRSSLVSDHVPLWGCVSICGRRQEMEDAATALTRYLEVPLHMLGSQGRLTSGTNQGQGSSCLSHFFGVYDGHGGAKVANYCKERVHRALIEEMRNLPQVQGTSSDNLLKQWERIFINCFNKVDAEVAGERATASDDGSAGTFEAIAPETVGSTAVVSVVSPTHIIVANCGDSRAVLYRGKQPMPLSVDHKPNREDEYARIEAAGGKVIQWNGYRVLGVLAMSRSIGDRYLKPWVISEPEVMWVPRTKEDECLILASDGLWDVLSNDEVCDTARKRILLWHKKNGGNNPSEGRSDGPDPAAEAAADYLTKLALHKGSKDNVTVIVIDLKAQRKFKSRT